MSSGRPIIEWTREKRDALRAALKIAEDQGKESFMFEGHEFLTSYARYLLQYLDGRNLP